MSVKQPGAAPAPNANARVRSFLGWAFLISLAIHAVALPFFGLKQRHNEQPDTEKVSVTRKIKVVVPTPPPPTPTPPPPTPPPKNTPPPVKQTNPPPQPKLKLNVVKTTSHSGTNSESRYVAPAKGSENGNPNGTTASGPPAPVATAAATPEPTPTPTQKPSCANPNADATISGEPVEPDYPDIAREQGAVGTTQVKVTLDASGNVTDASVYKSSGSQALDQSAVKAARATRYSAETVNCVKTAGSYIFRADFTGQ
jgi:protein TonB